MYSAEYYEISSQINHQVNYIVKTIKSEVPYDKKKFKLLAARKVLVALFKLQTDPDFPGLFQCTCMVN